MSIRRWRILSAVSLSVPALMLLPFYFAWIAPYFEDSELTNSAVLEAINTKRYQEETEETFQLLSLYNQGKIELDALHGLQGVQPIRGVTVVYNLKLAPRNEPREGGGQKYKIEGQYKVSLSIGYLILFLSAEMVLIGTVITSVSLGSSKAQRRFEEQILQTHFSLESPVLPTPVESAEELVGRMLKRFHNFAIDLETHPRKGQKGIQVNNEYDVQFLVNALMGLHFDNVKSEEPTPSIAASSSRLDFLLPEYGIVIETKYTYQGRPLKKLNDEMINDIARYRIHPECRLIIFFVYDRCRLIRSPATIQMDLSKISGDLPVRLIVSPSHL